MKDMKKKLFAATAMLLVSAVMLGSSTFAWYTLSTAPEISKISAKVASNENLEIALDNGYEAGETSTGVTNTVDAASKFDSTSAGGSQTGNYYSWGNLIDLTYAFDEINSKTAADGDVKSQLLLAPVKGVLTPATTTDNAKYEIKYPVYGLDGRLSKLSDASVVGIKNVAGTQTETDKDPAKYAPDTYGVAVYERAEKNTSGHTNYDAFSITYWLRSNEKAEVSLSTAVERAKSAQDDGANGTTTGNKGEAGYSPADVNGVEGKGSYVEFTLAGHDADTNAEGIKDGNGNEELKENLEKLDNMVKHLVIEFVEYGKNGDKETMTTVGYAHLDLASGNKDEGGKIKATTDNKVKYNLTLKNQKQTVTGAVDKTITLEANKGKKIMMLVYLDGETLTNANALVEDMGMEMNIQFTSNAIDSGAMDGATDENKPEKVDPHYATPTT